MSLKVEIILLAPSISSRFSGKIYQTPKNDFENYARRLIICRFSNHATFAQISTLKTNSAFALLVTYQSNVKQVC